MNTPDDVNQNDVSSRQAIDAQKAEAARYATLLEWGTRLGLIALVISFSSYVLGWLQPHVPLQQLPQLWHLSAEQYLLQTAMPTGWGWLALAGKGDVSNLIGIALLAACSLPPLLGLAVLYLRRGDRAYAVICALVALVVALAASGVLTAGH